MKKGIIFVLIVLTAGISAFASGQNEPVPPGVYGPCFAPAQEPESLSGTLDFTALGTVLKTQGQEWNLLYPRWVVHEVELKRGQTVSVEGYSVRPPQAPEGELYLHVTKATINGETYELATPPSWNGGRRQPRPMDWQSPGPAPRHGHGHGWGW